MEMTIDLEKIHAEIGKLIAETTKLNAETAKLNAEAVNLNRESRWYPVVWATAFAGAVLGLAKYIGS